MDQNELFDEAENIIKAKFEKIADYVSNLSDEEFDEAIKNLTQEHNEYEMDFLDLMDEEDSAEFSNGEYYLDEEDSAEFNNGEYYLDEEDSAEFSNGEYYLDEEDSAEFSNGEYYLDENMLLNNSMSTTADLTVPKEVLEMYSKDQIIYSPAFYTSPCESYPSRNCRINIYSYKMHDEKDITIGGETYQLNKFTLNPFKIIDIYTINKVTQLTLIPFENYELAYMKSNTLEIEDELIEKSRASFEKSFDNKITPNLTAQKNILPIGTYKYNGEYHLYNKIELCQLLTVFIRLYDVLKEDYLNSLQEPSILNQIYMECLDYENENMDKDTLNALTSNETDEEINIDDVFSFADELQDSLYSKLVTQNSEKEGFILNDFEEKDVFEKHINEIKKNYSEVYSEDREPFLKSLLTPDISSPKSLIKFEKELVKIYKEHTFTYIYESNLPASIINLYKKGQILNELTPIKVQTKEHKPTKTCLFKIILPYGWKFNKNSQTDPEDKICESYLSQKFKLIDIYEKNNVTQLTLMGIFPDDEFLFKQRKVSLEKQYIKKSRAGFEKSFKLDSTYETFNNGPLGMYKDGEKYTFYQNSDICNLLDIKTKLFENLPLSQSIKYGEKIDINKLLLEYNKFLTENPEIETEKPEIEAEKPEIEVAFEEFFYSEGINPVKCDEFSKTIPSIIDKLLKEEED